MLGDCFLTIGRQLLEGAFNNRQEGGSTASTLDSFSLGETDSFFAKHHIRDHHARGVSFYDMVQFAFFRRTAYEY